MKSPLLPPLAAALVLTSCGDGRAPLSSVDDDVVDTSYELPTEVDRAYEDARAELERALSSPDPLAALRWFSPELVGARDLIVEAHESGRSVVVDFAPVAPVGDGYLSMLHLYAVAPSQAQRLAPLEVPPRWVWVAPADGAPWVMYDGPPRAQQRIGRVTRVDAELSVDAGAGTADVDVVLHVARPTEPVIVFDFVHDLDVMAAIDVIEQDGQPLRYTHVRDKLVVELAEVGAAAAVHLRYRLTPLTGDRDVESVVSRGPWIPRRPGSEPAWNVRRVTP